jgi:predicted O-methyltransferase YrrM
LAHTLLAVIPSTRTPPVADALAAIRDLATTADAEARARVAARVAELGRITTAEKYELYGEAPPLAITPEVGDLLYLLVRIRRPGLVVEFGASHGLSTIYLAAALRDAGAGALLTTEILPGKAAATARNLAAAGLADLVEIRIGDALDTLQEVAAPIDLVFLDGRNDFYLPVLRLLEPRLSAGAVVAADLSADDPDLLPYLDRVRNGPYATVELPLAAGLAVSIWTA